MYEKKKGVEERGEEDQAEKWQQLWYPATIHYHTCMAHGRFERTIGQKLTLFESYVLKLLRVNQLRDPNTNFRIE